MTKANIGEKLAIKKGPNGLALSAADWLNPPADWLISKQTGLISKQTGLFHQQTGLMRQRIKPDCQRIKPVRRRIITVNSSLFWFCGKLYENHKRKPKANQPCIFLSVLTNK